MTEYREDQFTAWFPPHIKPVHVGVYPTQWGYAYWNGKQWGFGRKTPDLARRFPDYRRKSQNKRWRGLNFNPASTEGAPA